MANSPKAKKKERKMKDSIDEGNIQFINPWSHSHNNSNVFICSFFLRHDLGGREDNREFVKGIVDKAIENEGNIASFHQTYCSLIVSNYLSIIQRLPIPLFHC